MRLINTRTLELEEFFGEKIPKYAIFVSYLDKRGAFIPGLELDQERAGFGTSQTFEKESWLP